MSKIVRYIVGTLVVFLIILAFQNWRQSRKIERQENDILRLKENQKQLLDEKNNNIVIIQTKDEFISTLTSANDSLLKELKIRPRTVTKIVERIEKQIIRDTVPIDVNPYKDMGWRLRDSIIVDNMICMRYGADVWLDGYDLGAERTYYETNNKTIDVCYRRLKWKFLFIRVYDKDKIDIKSKSVCGGEVQTKTVEVIKGK